MMPWHNRQYKMAVLSESPMTTTSRIDPRLLAYELAIRGRSWTDLTRCPASCPPGICRHRVNSSTVTKIRKGEDISPGTKLKIGRWLRDAPVDRELASVTAKPSLEGAA
jgi:hypothetical protein